MGLTQSRTFTLPAPLRGIAPDYEEHPKQSLVNIFI